MASQLDFAQIITQLYDDVKNRLRTDAELSMDSATIDVHITDATDSVKIGDGAGDYLGINPDGSINVNISGTSSQVTQSTYNEVTSVSNSAPTSLVTYSVLADGKLKQINVAGTNIAVYQVLLNSVVIDKKYTYFGSSLDLNFNYGDGIPIVMGDQLEVLVTHFRPSLGDFNGRIQVTEE